MTNAPQHPSAQQYKAYANATMTVGKVRQVVMLYDGIIRFVQQAAEAIERGDVETRFNQLAKASAVLGGLQNSLDFENGGDISKLLYDYYASIDARIFTVHRTNDATVCEAVIKELKMMRDAWDGIDRKNGKAEEEAVAKSNGRSSAESGSTEAVSSDRVEVSSAETSAPRMEYGNAPGAISSVGVSA